MSPYGIIYLVTHKDSGKSYVGQTIKPLSVRWTQHCSSAKRNSRLKFHQAIKKYGRDAFDVEVLTEASSMDELNHLEALWIILSGSYLPGVGYNLSMGGGNQRATPETRARMSAAHKGHAVSVEARNKMSEAKTGLPTHPATKAGLLKAIVGNQWNVGSKRPDEVKARMSEAMKGIPKSAEHVEQMRQRFLGNTNWLGKSHSEQSKRLMSEARMGFKPSNETLLKMSEARKGVPWSAARRQAFEARFRPSQPITEHEAMCC